MLVRKQSIAGADKADCEAERQKLVYKGKILKDDDTLASYGEYPGRGSGSFVGQVSLTYDVRTPKLLSPGLGKVWTPFVGMPCANVCACVLLLSCLPRVPRVDVLPRPRILWVPCMGRGRQRNTPLPPPPTQMCKKATPSTW